jgi:lauroyl/myristoyl acyltransferase
MLPTLILIRLGMALSLLLPLRIMKGLAAFAWRIGGSLSPRRRIVAANLAAVRAAGGAVASPGSVFAGYGRYWAELVHLAARPGRLDGLDIRVEGREHLEAVEAGRGILVLSAHLGSWDLLSYWLGATLPGISILVEELKPPALYRLFTRIREAGGARVLSAEGAGPRLYRRLKGGEHAVLAGDRVFGAGLRELPLLGGKRRLPSGGVKIARRAGAALLPIFLLREGYSYVIKVFPDLSATPDPLAAYAAHLEAEILARPDQWCVLYPLHDARNDQAAAGRPVPLGDAKGATVR